MTEESPAGGDRLAALEAALGHRFRDRALLETALVHSSRGGRGADRRFDRLEFLGDRVLALVVAELLLERFPEESEGELARRFARLVSAELLAALADEIDLARHLAFGHGQAKDLLANRAVLADAFEAVLAALHRDGGIDAARVFLARVYAVRLADAPEPPEDPKNTLQEWALARGLGLPVYRDLERSGPEHALRFRVEVEAGGHQAAGEGGSKRAAERGAAAALLARLAAESGR